MIENGGDLYRVLEPLKLLEAKPPMWWPAYGTFEVVVGAVLTQNSQWTRVEHSLRNLRDQGLLTPEGIAEVPGEILSDLIRPSGLYQSKARTLGELCRAMVEQYGDFETFCLETERAWLLARRGIGPETADSILCYGCGRAAMVVDAYTARLVAALGYECEDYDALQAWCRGGIEGDTTQRARDYALLHGMIVEYVKRYKRGRSVETAPLVNQAI